MRGDASSLPGGPLWGSFLPGGGGPLCMGGSPLPGVSSRGGAHSKEISLLGAWSSLPGEAHFGVSICRRSFLLGDGVLCALRSPF